MLTRHVQGSTSINYLLKNWDAETTVCRENGGECKRDADPVRRYMGLRSTTDPLFQIEKVKRTAKRGSRSEVGSLSNRCESISEERRDELVIWEPDSATSKARRELTSQ